MKTANQAKFLFQFTKGIYNSSLPSWSSESYRRLFYKKKFLGSTLKDSHLIKFEVGSENVNFLKAP